MHNDFINKLEISEELKQQLRLEADLCPLELEARIMAGVKMC
jgi:hypothetical protein